MRGETDVLRKVMEYIILYIYMEIKLYTEYKEHNTIQLE